MQNIRLCMSKQLGWSKLHELSIPSCLVGLSLKKICFKNCKGQSCLDQCLIALVRLFELNHLHLIQPFVDFPAPLHQMASSSGSSRPDGGRNGGVVGGVKADLGDGGLSGGGGGQSGVGGDKYPSQPPPPVPPSFAKTEIYRDPTVFAGVDERAIRSDH